MSDDIILLLIISILIIIYYYNNNNSNSNNKKENHINNLVRQAHRWYIASKQDSHPLVKILHANYAVGYAGAILSIASEKEIQDATGLKIRNFQAATIVEQDKALKKLIEKCPELIPDDKIYRDYLNSL